MIRHDSPRIPRFRLSGRIGAGVLLAVLLLPDAIRSQTTYYWNRNDVLTTSADFNKAYNWTANADGTGDRPASSSDDAFTADALDADWTFRDNDNDAGTGTNSLTTNADQLTLSGRGADIFSSTNQYTAVYRSDITGDFDVTVKVLSITNTSSAAKAGIYMADDFTTLASGGFAGINWRGDGKVEFQYDATGNVGELDPGTATAGAVSGPVWIRLVKSGSSVSGFYRNSQSNDWTQVGATQTIQSTAANSQIAIAHCSHNAGSTGTAVFDDFQGGAILSATNNIFSFNGSGAGYGYDPDANATLSASIAGNSIDFTGYSGTFDFGSSTLTINSGNATFASTMAGITAGTGTLAFTGNSGTQTFTPKSGATFPAITKSGASGTLTVSTNALTAGALTLSSGTWDWGSSTLSHTLASITTAGSSTMTFGTNTVTVNSGNVDFSGLATLNTVSGSNLWFSANSGTQTFTPLSGATHPRISKNNSGILKLSTNTLICRSFSMYFGYLDFNGVNLTTNNSGNYLQNNGTTGSMIGLNGRTITVAGSASFSGQSGNLLNLSASAWTLTVTGAVSATYANIAGSNASGGSMGVAYNSTNGGGNSNWNFPPDDYSSWSYSTLIQFNTTSTGANVSGNVTNFPMLVRLDSNNFIFAQAQPDGRDIRFADPDGSTLPYQIERWSASLRKAEIWVKVPQVDGNSSADYIKMYWGNGSAAALSDGKAVFDTANGYQGVWHLNEEVAGTGTANLYQDATANDNDGDDNISATGSAGLVGLGHQFDGTDDYIATGSGVTKIADGKITLSLWVKLSGNGGSILNKGDGDGTWETGEKEFYFGDGTNGAGVNGTRPQFVGYTTGYGISASSVGLNDWHHLTYTWDNTSAGSAKWYIDGALTSMSTNGITAVPADQSGSTVRIGMKNANESNAYFSGYMDELEMSSAVRSADFIKLTYETQKASTQALVYANSALSTWSYNAKLYVNTTASGANVSADVDSFPLLVRLTPGNFNFSQARSDGADIRFADSAGTLLAYEIERWDATAKAADIWVLVPKVRGNNNSQWFRMYWGKATASSLSSGPAVFRLGNGFAGTWHLGEDGNTTSGGYADATANGFHGTGTAMTNASDVAGAIGKGQTFDGSTTGINVGGGSTGSGLHATTSLTLEGWVKAAAKVANVKIVNKSYTTSTVSPYLEYDLSMAGNATNWTAAVTTSTSPSWTEGVTAISTGTWYHVASTYDGSYIRIYVNGVLDATPAAKTGAITDYARAVRIGTYEADPAQTFTGVIDEVRIATAVRSADWIKLSYETQKAGSAVVQVGPRTTDFTKAVRLNFNTVGMGLSGNVANIPILVRLSSSNFDFTAATATGADIQFVDPDGTYLYHEVVEWDPGNRTGKVWVKVPSVTANASSDYITLYYGCTGCAASPYAVKDSVWSGYTGVFHLNAPENQASDAATLANHGAYNQTQAFGSGVTVKNAPYFNGSTDYVTMPTEANYDFATNISVSAWVKGGSLANAYATIAAKGTTSFRLSRNDGDNGAYFSANPGGVSKPVTGSVNINDGNWHYVVGVYDGSFTRLYVDGAADGTPAAATGSVTNVAYALSIGNDLEDLTRRWTGYISEVRVSNNSGVLSADFIKLSHENQKAASTLFSSTTFSTASFQRSKVFKFNTTSTGANIARDVYNFPLLLRITGSSILDAVQPGGTDIRFLDADGVTWLDYQVQRWDNGSKDSAEVWVKVPKIDGNSSSDYITMYYQQASGITIPSGQCAACTFDGGFIRAMYHMDTSSTSTVPDSRGVYNGTYTISGSTPATNLYTGAGYIGSSSISFDGASKRVVLGGAADIVRNVEGVTFSAWVQTAISDGARHNVVWLGRDLTNSSRAKLSLHTSNYIMAGGRSNTEASAVEGLSTANALSLNTWYHVAAVIDYKSDSIKTYVNGVRSNPSAGTAGFTYRKTSNTAGVEAMIGSSGNGTTEEWSGLIDEVQICGTAMDTNWVKLLYQSQRRDASPLFNPSPTDFRSTAKLTFNTTRTGANVMSDVSDFPLLVRLTGSTILDAVQSDYDDIRFLDGDGKTWLDYQVERWDNGSKDSAEVWVKIPKVDGNSNTDFITLYYDDSTNGAVANGECASCVFAPANGFAGVYHLNQAGNNTASNYADASGNGYHGSGTNMVAGSSVDAMAGLGTAFGGTNYVSFGTTVGSAASQTVSFWMKATALGNQVPVDKLPNDASDIGWNFKLRSSTDSAIWYRIGSETTGHSSDMTQAGAYTAGTWVHVTGTFGSGTGRLYLNGALRNEVTGITKSPANSTTTMRIGIPSVARTTEVFSGTLDELQVSSAVRDSNWVRLTYETQRRTGNLFWNSRPGPNNKATLTGTANSGSSISLAWTTPVSDSSAADSVGLWLKYSDPPDSVGAAGQSRIVVLPKTDSTYSFPATYPGTYYFALAVRNTSGQWSPFTRASTDTVLQSGDAGMTDTVYVDSAIGSTSNSCTAARNPATPKSLISGALSAQLCETNGIHDTLVVRVMAGTYTNADLNSDNKPIVIASFDNDSRAVLTGSSTITDGTSQTATVWLRNDVTMRNLNIRCSVNGVQGIHIHSADANQRITGCRIYNGAGAVHDFGIYVPGVVNQRDITKNLIYQPATYGVYISSDNSFNVVHNTFIGNGNSGTYGIYANHGGGYTDMSLTNNIFYNWDYGIYTASANVGSVSNNLFHLVTSGREVTGPAYSNNILKDPLFYGTTLSDRNAFKLLPGSPAIDAGTSTFASGAQAVPYRSYLDFFGNTRPQGSAPDIGIYEGSGYTPNPTGEFDSLVSATVGNTVIVKNSKFKLVWDMARGAGINGFYDMTGDTTANLVAAASLLFDATIDAYTVSSQTGNTLAPSFVERGRAMCIVGQRLAVSATTDLRILYTVYASGHVYIQSELSNLSGSSLAVGTVQYALKASGGTAVLSGGAGTKNGFGYLTTSTRDVLLAATRDLDEGASTTEAWSQSTAANTVRWTTSDLVDLPLNMKRRHHFLLYVGDKSLDYSKAATLHADARTPAPLAVSSGSLLMERTWQDRLAGHWTADEGAGTVLRDKSVNSLNNAALSGSGYKFVTGKIGAGIYLTAASMATVPDNDSLEAARSLTVMFWLKPDFSGGGTTEYILSKGVTTSDGWFVRKVSGQSQIEFTMGSATVTSPALTDAAWTHVAVKSLNGGNRNLEMYVNGVLAAVSSTAATVAANSSSLLIGYSSGSTAADKFQGTLDDIRIYNKEIANEDILSICNRGFTQKAGYYSLRADNNNRLVALINADTAQTRFQPAFKIDNWYGPKTPKYVYLSGTRLVPVTDFITDSLGNDNGNGAYLILQVNKTLTAADQTLFVDDDDSTGYMGEAAKMKTLTIAATAGDKIVIKNFADTVFGSRTSGQWYTELDLDGWTSYGTATASDIGYGSFNVWKAAATHPSLAISGAANQVGRETSTGRGLMAMKFDETATANKIFSGGTGYASPATLTYTLIDSSATRFSLTLASISLQGDGTASLLKRYTVYPTGRIFASYTVSSPTINLDGPMVYLTGRYDADAATAWSDATSQTQARMALMGGSVTYHSLAGCMLGIKNVTSTYTTGGTMNSASTTASGNTGVDDYLGMRFTNLPALTTTAKAPITVNFMVDISRDFTDSATADSLLKDAQNPAVLTAISGTRTTTDALDFNQDNFAEGDGAYTYAAAASGIAHFKFVNSVASFSPAFRISSWTFGTLPEVVLLDNQTLTRGYQYNAYLKTASNEVILQLNKTLAPGTHALYISHKTGLAVTLRAFTATGGDGVDSLAWTTESEFENLGYHVYRRPVPGQGQPRIAAEASLVQAQGNARMAQDPSGNLAAAGAGDSTLDTLPSRSWSEEELAALGYVRITPKLIPGAKGGSSASTMDYAFLDRTATFGVWYEYLLEAVDFNGGRVQYGPRQARPETPLTTELYGNYPNPFNPITTLRFSLKETLKVSLVIYDARGRLVRTLIRPEKPMLPGKYRLMWDAKSEGGFEAPSGQYFYRFTAGRYVKTRKMILVK